MKTGKLIKSIPHTEHYKEKNCLTLLLKNNNILILRPFEEKILYHLFNEKREQITFNIDTEDNVAELFSF